MSYRKIIPCLDVKDGRVVKGINFVDLKDITDPSEAAEAYSQSGADELVLLDIMATFENRPTFIEVIKQTAQKVKIPFTVGGGISSLADIDAVLSAGADKVSINTAAVVKPAFLPEAVAKFGQERIVIAIDVKRRDNLFSVVINGGHTDIKTDALTWAKQAAEMGAGELLVTSMDRDGTKEGYDIELLEAVSSSCGIPVIASGGAGSKEHFKDVFTQTKVSGALAASLFHYKELEIPALKKYLKDNGIEVNV